jgi:hypothetical protein
VTESRPLYWTLHTFECGLSGCPPAARDRFTAVLRGHDAPASPVDWHWDVEIGPDTGYRLVGGFGAAFGPMPEPVGGVHANVDALLTALEFGAVSKLYDHLDALHAALLSRNGRAVVIIGPKEAGKSTLSAALWGRGWDLLADDGAILGAAGRWYPVPRRVSLRSGGLALLDPALEERLLASPSGQRRAGGVLFHPQELGQPASPDGVMLAAVVFLARLDASAGPAEAVVIAPTDALLAGCAYLSTRSRRGFGEALRVLGPVFDAVPAFDLGRGPLDAMVATVERLADEHG